MAVQVVPANPSRKRCVIVNDGDADAFLGRPGVTTSNGLMLPAGSWITDETSTDAWWVAPASAAANLRVREVV